jgi:hypothetical protein
MLQAEAGLPALTVLPPNGWELTSVPRMTQCYTGCPRKPPTTAKPLLTAPAPAIYQAVPSRLSSLAAGLKTVSPGLGPLGSEGDDPLRR